MDRRDFIKFLGGASTAALAGCSSTFALKNKALSPAPGLAPQTHDDVVLMSGVSSYLILKAGMQMNSAGDHIGSNCDYLHPLVLGAPDELLLWINFESVHPLLTHGKVESARGLLEMKQEMKEVGGGFCHLKKNSNNQWSMVFDSPMNQRFDANTPFEIVAEHLIRGEKQALGTLANCAGGFTPWGSILTCEENYDHFWGEVVFEKGRRKVISREKESLDWFRKVKPVRPPEHYGWVVEIKPGEKSGKKLTALGRFAHEGALVTKAGDGRLVVYMGDDKADEHLYKFVSESPDSLDKGELFVADTIQGQWLSLKYSSHPKFKKRFRHQTDLLVRTREAAKIVGATPLARPEDIEINEAGDVFVALTNNKKRDDFYGSILKLREKNNDRLARNFSTEIFQTGSPQNGFACPDNIAFDRWGNFWFTTDISGNDMSTEKYRAFGNNALFVIPVKGPHQGTLIRVATAPRDAEFTGPVFSPDGETLFLCVQHPGELTKKVGEWTSHWPDGGKPLSGVIALEGQMIRQAHDLR